MIRRWLDSMRALRGRARFERDMDDEMAFHLERQTADHIRNGLAPAEARRRARAQFGATEGFKEDAREARGIAWVDQLRSDLRFAVRTLRRSPGYAAAAVLTLALGIGANTAIFSVIDGVLLKPLAFPESGRLVQVTSGYPALALPIYRTETRSYQSVGSYAYGGEVNLLVDGEPERVNGRQVSAEFFELLGIRAALGRTFRAGDDAVDAAPVAAISDRLWRRRFGADPAVIGRSVVVDGTPREIVGVMPRGFEFPTAGTEVWLPNRLDPADQVGGWGTGGTTMLGRLKPGVTVEQANAEHRALIPRVRDAYPWRMPDNFGLGAANQVVPLTAAMGEPVRDRLLLLLGAVGLVLLVACANVANLNLTRVAGREREFAVRQAIGGSRGRLGRQVLVEQLVIAGLGGGVGVLLALVGTPLLVRWLPAGTPRLDAVSVDGRVLLFTAAVVVLAAAIAALGPIGRATRSRGASALGAAGRQAGLSRLGRRMSAALVVGEVALAVVLLVGAGLLIRSLGATLARDPGVRIDRIVTARITQDPVRCGANMESCLVTFGRIEERLAAIPGVRAVALTSRVPLDGQIGWFAMDVEGHPIQPGEPAHMLGSYHVTPGYFDLAGIRIEEGRGFEPSDNCVAATEWVRCGFVVVVSRTLAEKYWPGQSAIGKRIKPVWLQQWARVVGVVGDVRPEGLNREPTPEFYLPLSQWGVQTMTALVETSLPRSQLEPALRAAVASVDPVTPVSGVRSMASIVDQSVASSRTTAVLLTIFAAAALLLGAIGVYGVLAYTVAGRRQEIGVRLAIGAEPSRVRAMVVRQAMAMVGGGLVLGVLLAGLGSGLLEGFVYGVGVRDPVTFVAVPALFVLVGLVAAWLPARRATRVPPTVALRSD